MSRSMQEQVNIAKTDTKFAYEACATLKRKVGRLEKGNAVLRKTLTEASGAASKQRFRAQDAEEDLEDMVRGIKAFMRHVGKNDD